MLQESGARAVVYQVLDQVLADHTVAPASRSAIFSVVDDLRQGSAPLEDLRRAESISIEIHKLGWALQQNDGPACEAALDQLRALATSWLHSRIGS